MAAATSAKLDPKKASARWRVTLLCLPLSLVICFCIATHLGLWFQSWQGNRAGSADMMAVALGDARRMFANHFFVKADAYFHSGFYPTIFDNRQSFETPHIAEDSGAAASNNTGDELGFLGPPRNWIDRFGRQFYPSTHTHLDSGGADHEGGDAVQEILPWLKLSVELDPKRVETYTVTAYWLRRIGKVNEAEQFLRDGLKENPSDPQLLFDLGRIFFEYRHDPVRARNVWEAGLRNLSKLPDKDKNDDTKFVEQQLLGSLAKLEEQEHNFGKAISLFEQLKAISPSPEEIQKRIDELRQKPPVAKAEPAAPPDNRTGNTP